MLLGLIIPYHVGARFHGRNELFISLAQKSLSGKTKEIFAKTQGIVCAQIVNSLILNCKFPDS